MDASPANPADLERVRLRAAAARQAQIARAVASGIELTVDMDAGHSEDDRVSATRRVEATLDALRAGVRARLRGDTPAACAIAGVPELVKLYTRVAAHLGPPAFCIGVCAGHVTPAVMESIARAIDDDPKAVALRDKLFEDGSREMLGDRTRMLGAARAWRAGTVAHPVLLLVSLARLTDGEPGIVMLAAEPQPMLSRPFLRKAYPAPGADPLVCCVGPAVPAESLHVARAVAYRRMTGPASTLAPVHHALAALDRDTSALGAQPALVVQLTFPPGRARLVPDMGVQCADVLAQTHARARAERIALDAELSALISAADALATRVEGAKAADNTTDADRAALGEMARMLGEARELRLVWADTEYATYMPLHALELAAATGAGALGEPLIAVVVQDLPQALPLCFVYTRAQLALAVPTALPTALPTAAPSAAPYSMSPAAAAGLAQ